MTATLCACRGRHRLLWLLAVLLALGIVVGCPGEARAESVTIKHDKTFFYGPGLANTAFRSIVDVPQGCTGGVQCVEPDKTGLQNGESHTYPKEYHSWKNADVEAEMRAVLWFGCGGPGYGKVPWPRLFSDNTVKQNDYLLTHVLLGYLYTGSVERSCADMPTDKLAQVKGQVLGLGGAGGAPAAGSVRAKIRALMGEVPSRDQGFDVFLLNTAHAHTTQAYAGFIHTPPVTVTVVKSCRAQDRAVTRNNGDYSLEGAKFQVRRSSDEKLLATVVTDRNGRATCSMPPRTSCYLTEVTAPAGYRRDTSRVSFTTGAPKSSMEVSVSDTPQRYSVELCKRDASTGAAAQPGVSLEGARFSATYWRDGALVTSTATTDAEGRLWFRDLPLGPLTIKELAAPTGYQLDPELAAGKTYHVTSRDGGPEGADFTYGLPDAAAYQDAVEACDLTITKFAGNDNNESGPVARLAGVRFDIYSNTTGERVGWLTTDERGLASTADGTGVDEQFTSPEKTLDPTKPWFGAGRRDPGRVHGALPYDAKGYTVKEALPDEATDLRPMPDQVIGPEAIVDGNELTWDVYNKTVRQRLQVVKLDAETGARVPMRDFQFQLLDEQGQPVVLAPPFQDAAPSSVWSTDENGSVVFPSELAPGTYRVHEVSAQSPYLRAPEDIEVTLDGDASHEPVAVAQCLDDQALGQATVEKTCSETGEGLDGAEYDVVAQEDVVDPAGVTHAVMGEVVDHVVTDPQGRATTRLLHLGRGTARYAFIETRAPEGHVLDPTPREFTLAYEDDGTPLVTAEVSQRNAPTGVRLHKEAKGRGPLGGVTFTYWRAADAVRPEGPAVVVRTGSDSSDVRLVPHDESELATVTFAAPADCALALAGPDGKEQVLETELEGAVGARLVAGVYSVAPRVGGEPVAWSGVKDVTLEAGRGYTMTMEPNALFGLGAWAVACQEDDPLAGAVTAQWREEDGAYEADGLTEGPYDLYVDGSSAGQLRVPSSGCAYATVRDGRVTPEPVLLRPGVAPGTTGETDGEGDVTVEHLAEGRWVFRELVCPPGYLCDPTEHVLVIDENGRPEGAGPVEVVDDFTKVWLSKASVATGEEVPGARLRILDAAGKVVDEWVSGKEPHLIEALAPGDYVLEETMTPQGYDVADRVAFTVAETGEPQRATLFDAPVSVTGQLDKRQEVAEPTAPYAAADATENDGGSNRTAPVASDGGYCYELDYRSTASTWVDELTVTDPLEAVGAGLAELEAVTTPRCAGDFDGRLNVWYQVVDTDGLLVAPDEVPRANATLDDGHDNPWLRHPVTAERLGSDGRVLDYDGWHLWGTVDATEPVTLTVADLGLPEGGRVSAVRFEHGRVEPGFTTSNQDWKRPDLKDLHDDVGDPEAGGEGLSPARLHMRVTGAYRAGTALANGATLELYRNGGGEPGLEGQDVDRVEQAPVERMPALATELTADGEHRAEAGSLIVEDLVSYEGVEPGVRHWVEGRLLSKRTGRCLAEARTSLFPEATEGKVSVRFSVDASELAGDDLVAFERLYGEEDEGRRFLASHEDPYDPAQTVSIVAPGRGLPRTGDPTPWVGGLVAAAAGLGAVAAALRRPRLRPRVRREGGGASAH